MEIFCKNAFRLCKKYKVKLSFRTTCNFWTSKFHDKILVTFSLNRFLGPRALKETSRNRTEFDCNPTIKSKTLKCSTKSRFDRFRIYSILFLHSPSVVCCNAQSFVNLNRISLLQKNRNFGNVFLYFQRKFKFRRKIFSTALFPLFLVPLGLKGGYISEVFRVARILYTYFKYASVNYSVSLYIFA